MSISVPKLGCGVFNCAAEVPLLAIALAVQLILAKSRSSPLEGDPPFYGYRWVFYASLMAGAAVAWLFARLRAGSQLGTAAAILWSIAGAIVGAIGFVVLMVVNGIMSVGFSPIQPWLLFCLCVAAEVFVLASLMQTTSRRRRFP